MNPFHHSPLLKRISIPAVIALSLPVLPLRATGDYWLPPGFLEGSGAQLKAAPEFFWHLEIRRLAEKYHAPEAAAFKPKAPPPSVPSDQSDEAVVNGAAESVKAADLADFEDALKSGRFQPADPAAARTAHAATRIAINSGKKAPEGGVEAVSEFSDYHEGAADPESEAGAAAWKRLLARPPEERHYRSVWAAFMLGKSALHQQDWPAAVTYFEACRKLAREGFADTPGLAADSYGWQGRAELMAAHFPAAAKLYLTQLWLGQTSAEVSLKRLIPGWMSPMSGGLPGEPLPEENPAAPPEAAAKPAMAESAATIDERLLEAAREPVLQELMTAHVLATDTGFGGSADRCREWLNVIAKAGVEKVADAASLAWAAYATGDFAAAAQWLEKTDDPQPLVRWLQAKLALREGKFETARKLMVSVEQEITDTPRVSYSPTPFELAAGESGALQYAKGQYGAALLAFTKGNCQNDVTFLVESILTPAELTGIVKQLPPPGEPSPEDSAPWQRPESGLPFLREAISRRFVREGRVGEGRPLLTETVRKAMDEYIAHATKAENSKLPAMERASSWWAAAIIMKQQGHLFRGTEVDFHRPEHGEFLHPLRAQRLTGKYDAPQAEDAATDSDAKPPQLPVFLTGPEDEKSRLAATAKHHAKPMRTRVIAASHLQKAAALLPESEEKTKLLNTAGFWLQDIDNPAADRIYNQIEKFKKPNPTSRAILQKHWFTGETNPWNPSLPADPSGVP